MLICTRRNVLIGGAGLLGVSCGNMGGSQRLEGLLSGQRTEASRGRLTARHVITAENTLNPGTHRIPVRGSREASLYVPPGTDRATPLPLVISLHGAGGNARHGVEMLQARADEHRFAILAPASRKGTWDVIVGGYGPDVVALEETLSYTFEHLRVRPETIAISGFSDGASYALSIGLNNGDLFRHILAFSPGFLSPREAVGKPRIFVSHGTEDTVLPIDRCSRRLVPQLRSAGYPLEYREFDGPHAVPEQLKDEAIAWWLTSSHG